MAIYFFDTSALQHRYVQGIYSSTVRRLISHSRNECYIADVTVLEIASALGKQCRQGTLRHERYDKADHSFWEDIHAGKLRVCKATPSEILRARNLLRFAGIIKKRNLGSSDALIAVCCLELALEHKKNIVFCTSDWTLYDILRQIDAYTAALSLHFFGIPKR
jgi:predicted nucleic acid-binding protein